MEISTTCVIVHILITNVVSATWIVRLICKRSKYYVKCHVTFHILVVRVTSICKGFVIKVVVLIAALVSFALF